jgi:hypothetical protein
VTDIKIVCKARTHQRRPQIVAQFRDIGDGLWNVVSGKTRDGLEYEYKSTQQFLDGDEPSDGGQHPATDLYRLRYRFECRMCDVFKPARAENLFGKFNQLCDARPDRDVHVIPLHIL